MLPKNQWVNDEIKATILKHLEKNENTTIQNLEHAAKAVLRGKHVVTQTLLKDKRNLK